jgi:hypothetical protein
MAMFITREGLVTGHFYRVPFQLEGSHYIYIQLWNIR